MRKYANREPWGSSVGSPEDSSERWDASLRVIGYSTVVRNRSFPKSASNGEPKKGAVGINCCLKKSGRVCEYPTLNRDLMQINGIEIWI
jgi:hypothetical protein